mgnify:CR=1 FL=1
MLKMKPRRKFLHNNSASGHGRRIILPSTKIVLSTFLVLLLALASRGIYFGDGLINQHEIPNVYTEDGFFRGLHNRSKAGIVIAKKEVSNPIVTMVVVCPAPQNIPIKEDLTKVDFTIFFVEYFLDLN